jgi:hypothetical protein
MHSDEVRKRVKAIQDNLINLRKESPKWRRLKNFLQLLISNQ